MGNGCEIAPGENAIAGEWTAHGTKWQERVGSIWQERSESVRNGLALLAAMLIVLAAPSVESDDDGCKAATQSDRCLQATEME